MMQEIKLFTFLLILNIPSSIQQSIEHNDVEAPNTYEVLQDLTEPVLEEIIPSNTIQVIDVKDDHHQVISNLENMVISHEIDNAHNDSILNYVPLIQEQNNTIVIEANGTVNAPKTLDNQPHRTNVKADNRLVSSQNVSYVQSNSTTQQNVTTAKKDLSSISSVQNVSSSNNDAQNNGLNSFIGRRIGDNSGVINVTFTNNNAIVSSYNNVISNKSDSGSNPFNTSSVVWRSDVPIKKINNSKLSISSNTKNGSVNSPNNNTTLIYNNKIINSTASTEVIDDPIDVVALLNDTNLQALNLLLENNQSDSNDTIEESDTSYRSDFSRKKHYVNRIASKSKSQTNQYITEDDISKEKSLETNDSNRNPDNIFLIMNTGNITGFQANTPDKRNVQKLNSNLTIDNSNSKLLSSVIDTSLNNLAANILDQNSNITKSKNVFLILNSGTISNFQYDSRNPDGNTNNVAKDSFEHNKNEHKENFSIDKNNRIVDIKFRKIGNSDAINHETSIDNEDEISLDNDALSASTASELITLNNEGNEDQIQSNSNTDFKNNNNFDLGQALFGVEPINTEFDLTNLNVLNGAIDILYRLKRSSKKHKRKHIEHKHDDKKSNEKNKHLKDSQQCKNLIESSENYVKEISSKNAKLLDTLKFNNSTDENDCPLSIIFKLAFKQLYDQLTSSDNLVLNIIFPYLSDLMEGKDVIINLAIQELINLPFSIKIRLQLLQGDRNEIIKEILLFINSILCQ